MLVSISCTGSNSSDLGFLLHKHPDRVRSVAVGGGHAHVFYPEAGDNRTTAVLFTEVDPIGLSRRARGRKTAATLEPYVNDRPYVASSMLSAAIGKLYGTAMSGTCEARPELVDQPLNLEISVPVVGAPQGGNLIGRLFEPLGWEASCTVLGLDPVFEHWGDSRLASMTLRGSHTVKDTLAHLTVLLPVLDGRKHYWIDRAEVDKLLRRGGDWLAAHPERELISRRYLRFGSLARDALARLAEGEVESDEHDEGKAAEEDALEPPVRSSAVGRGATHRTTMNTGPRVGEGRLPAGAPSLNDQRLDAVMGAVTRVGGGSVVDVGCGEGRLLTRLVAEPLVTDVLGVDVSLRALERAETRLRLDEMSERRREQITLAQGALTYTDERLRGRDVATMVEVIEHLDPERLDVLAQVVFGDAAPQTVVVTTPNCEYNVHFEQLPHGRLRHGDHRFEWTRAEFGEWAGAICEEYGYNATFAPIGTDDPETGPPTQMAVFERAPHG